MSMRKVIAGLWLAHVVILPASVWAFNTSFLRDATLTRFTATDWTMFRETIDKALNENADGVAAAVEQRVQRQQRRNHASEHA